MRLLQSLFLISIFLLANIPVSSFIAVEDSNVSIDNLSHFPLDNNSYNSSKGKILVYSSFEARDFNIKVLEAQGVTIVQSYSFFPALFARFPHSVAFPKQYIPLNIYENKEFTALPENSEIWDLPSSFQYQENLDWTDTINVTPLWEKGLDGSGVKLGILDTGISRLHQDLTVVESYSFTSKEYDFVVEDVEDEPGDDFHSHGTHVAGIATGSGLSSNGEYRGVAPGVSLYNLKCLNYQGGGTLASVMAAINKAIELDLDIISLSFGWENLDPHNPVNLAVDVAVENGMTVVVAAGNSGPGHYTISSPGNANRVISVGASTIDGLVASFSSRGPTLDNRVTPDILAPGEEIISCLSEVSLTSYALQTFSPVPIVSGNLANSNYFVGSGTSMATPVVSGILALLKQAYPDVTPDALRAAITESALPINGLEVVKGSGIIDGMSAWEKLAATRQNGVYKITSVLPKQNLFLFDQPLFAGENRTTNLKIVKGHTSNLSVSLESGNISSFLHISNSSLLNADGYTEIELTVQAPLFVESGLYVGTLNVSDSKTGSQLIEIGPILITTPRIRVYWDLFHTDSADSYFGHYFAFFQYLKDLNIQVIEHNSSITNLELLGNSYQVLILPDAEIQYSEQELDSIREFVRRGGGVLILASHYPFSVNEAYNRIISPFGMSFNTDPVNVTDYGAFEVISARPRDLTLTSHELFLGVNNITWYAGSPVTAPNSIAFIDDKNAAMATFEGNNTFLGRILALGEEFPFYNSYLSEADHKPFAQNVLHWLAQRPQNGLSLQVRTKENIYKPNQEVEFAIQVNNGSNPLTIDFSSQILLSLTFANGTVQDGFHPIVRSISGGLYDFTVRLNEIGTFFLETALKPGSPNEIKEYSWVHSTLYITNITSLSVETANVTSQVPYWAEDVGIPVSREGNHQIIFQVTVNDSFVDSCSIYLTFIPEITYASEEILPRVPIYYYVLLLSYDGGVWSGSWDPDNRTPAGVYFFYTELGNASTPIEGQHTGTVFVMGKLPSIDIKSSRIAGKTLDQYNVTEHESQGLLTLNLGQSVDITIAGTDDSPQIDLNCFYLFAPFYAYLELDIWIDSQQMNFTTSGTWITTFTAPLSPSVPYNRNINIRLTNVALLLLIILKDPEGFTDIYPVFMQIIGFDLSTLVGAFYFLIPIVIFAVLGGLVIFWFIRRSRRSRISAYLDPTYRPQIPPLSVPPPIQQMQPKFCGYCGKPLRVQEKFCTHCGAEIRK
ncbi:MAG: DUF4350 domain-containing protein [Candidatus Hodarchaeota archaeon]